MTSEAPRLRRVPLSTVIRRISALALALSLPCSCNKKADVGGQPGSSASRNAGEKPPFVIGITSDSSGQYANSGAEDLTASLRDW